MLPQITGTRQAKLIYAWPPRYEYQNEDVKKAVWWEEDFKETLNKVHRQANDNKASDFKDSEIVLQDFINRYVDPRAESPMKGKENLFLWFTKLIEIILKYQHKLYYANTINYQSDVINSILLFFWRWLWCRKCYWSTKWEMRCTIMSCRRWTYCTEKTSSKNTRSCNCNWRWWRSQIFLSKFFVLNHNSIFSFWISNINPSSSYCPSSKH